MVVVAGVWSCSGSREVGEWDGLVVFKVTCRARGGEGVDAGVG